MFSVHLKTTVCITSCAPCIWIKKNQIMGKYIVIIDASFLLHIICFTNILRTVSCSKHKTVIWSYFTI